MARANRGSLWPLALLSVAFIVPAPSEAPAQEVRFGDLEGFRGTRVAGGVVFEPEGDWPGPGARPVVGFAPGAQGLGDRCVASEGLIAGEGYEASTVSALLFRGWAVAVTDHPAGVKDAEGRAVLDIVRAAQQLPDSDVTPASPVGLWGYGQGGQAAAAAAELEATYAPALDVRGTVAGAVPSDLRRMAEHLNGPDGAPYVGFLALVVAGLDAAHPDLDQDLDDEGRRLVDDLGRPDGPCVFDAVSELQGRHLAGIDGPAWQQRLAEQRLGTQAPAAPVFLFHGNGDQVVPFELGTSVRDAWCAQGAAVEFVEYPVEHLAGIYAGTGAGAEFLFARFTQEPPKETC